MDENKDTTVVPFRKKAEDQAGGLKSLGSKKTEYVRQVDAGLLEHFPNASPDRFYRVAFNTAEFTSLCPRTGQPDFGHVSIVIVPADKCVESKSLKLYLFSFRDTGAFMETITNKIRDDLVAAIQPYGIAVEIFFNPRGGIGTHVVVPYISPALTEAEQAEVGAILGSVAVSAQMDF